MRTDFSTCSSNPYSSFTFVCFCPFVLNIYGLFIGLCHSIGGPVQLRSDEMA